MNVELVRAMPQVPVLTQKKSRGLIAPVRVIESVNGSSRRYLCQEK
jgi:hypothetical protein